MLVAVDVALADPITRAAREAGLTVDLTITPQPRATRIPPSVLAAADWRVDAAHYTGSPALAPADVVLVDQVGANDLSMVPGEIGTPVLLLHNPGLNYLWSPGWDDMWIDTPAPVGLLDHGGIDIRFIVDPFAPLPLIPADGFTRNFLLHHGSDPDTSWAVSFNEDTYEWTFWWSTAGDTVESVTLAGTIGLKLARRAITADFATGTVTLFEQVPAAPARWFDLSTTSTRWRVADTATAGAFTPFTTTAPIRHGSSTNYDEIDGHVAYGWGGAIIAMQVRAGIDGPVAAGFNANDITIGPWGVVDGYPPYTGGSTTTSADGPFTGKAGETWTVHNFMTKSFPIVLVDRTALLFGSRAHATTPVDDDIFDVSPGDNFALAMAWRTPRTDTEGYELWSHKDGNISHSLPGIDALISYNAPGGVIALASDGGYPASAAPGPNLVPGDINVAVVAVDGAAETITVWSNGTPGVPATTAGIDTSVSGLPLLFAAIPDIDTFGSFELFSAAIFRRRVTPGEIAHLHSEMTR